MPSIAIELPHALGKEPAKEKLRHFLANVRQEYAQVVSELTESWEGDTLQFSFKTYGFQVSGKLQVMENQVKLDGSLPLAAMMFKGRVEQTIREQLERLLRSS